MSKEINITSNGIKQAIDDLVNENEMLQDKVYKLESIIKEVREYIEQKEISIFYQELGLLPINVKNKVLEILDKEKE